MSVLSTFLTERGVTQKAFALELGVDPSIVSRLRRGEMQPSLTLAFSIERATDGAVDASSWVDAPVHPLHPEPSAAVPQPAPPAAPSQENEVSDAA